MEELKPCPFCGGEARVEEKYGGWFVVRCSDCPCDIGRYWFPKKKQAIEAWNTRVGDRCTDCLVDRMLDDGR